MAASRFLIQSGLRLQSDRKVSTGPGARFGTKYPTQNLPLRINDLQKAHGWKAVALCGFERISKAVTAA